MNDTSLLGQDVQVDPGVTELDIFVGLILLCCFLLGGLGNTAAFIYFFRDTGTSTPLLVIYKFISFADIAKTILVLPMLLSYLCGRERLLFAGMVICTVWNITFTAMSQFSMFLVGLLSMVRSLYQFNRFYTSNSMTVIIIMVGLGIILLNLGPAIAWNLTSVYSSSRVTCGWFPLGEEADRFPYDVIDVLFTCIPIAILLPTAVSLGVNIYQVVRQEKEPTESDSSNQLPSSSFNLTPAEDRHSAITIIIITSVFLFFNSPLILGFLIDAADGTVDRTLTLLTWDTPHRYLANYIYILCLPLTAFANFFVFFTRMPGFRKGIQDKGMEGYSRVRPA